MTAARPLARGFEAMTSSAEAASRSSPVLAVVWIDLGAQGAVVNLYEPRDRRVFTRRLPMSGSEALAAEEVAIALRSAIGALLEGGPISMTQVDVRGVGESSEPGPDAKPAAPAAPAREEPASGPPSDELATDQAPFQRKTSGDGRALLGVGYIGTLPTKDATIASGARASVELRVGAGFLVGAGYGFFPSLTAEGPGVETRLSRHPAEAVLAYQVLSGRLGLEPEVLFIADLVRRRTIRAEPPLARAPAETRWLWAIGTRLRLRYSIAEGLGAFAAPGLDLVMNPFDQKASAPAGDESILSFRAIRPTLEAGLGLDLL